MVLERVTSFSSVLTLHVYSPDISTPGSLHTAAVSYTWHVYPRHVSNG